MVLLGAATRFGENAGCYIYSLFVISYVTKMLGLESSVALNAVLVGQGVAIVAIPLFAVLADRIGRKPINLTASVATIVWALVSFGLLGTKDPGLIIVAVAGGLLIVAMFSSVIGAFFSELFPTELRYSGVSIACNLASVVAGSLVSIIAIWLYARFEPGYAIGAYLAAMGLVSLIATLIAKETRETDLATVGR